MARKAKAVKIATDFKASKSFGKTDDDDDFIFGWEGLSAEPLMYEARYIVDDVWPNTPTPDVLAGVWDDTPIMRAVIAALRRGIELGQGDSVASA